jgi:hypothetical protein
MDNLPIKRKKRVKVFIQNVLLPWYQSLTAYLGWSWKSLLGKVILNKVAGDKGKSKMKSKQQSPCSNCMHQPMTSWGNACTTCMHQPVMSQANACTYCM